ncbi:MAG: stage II sporulation protein R [Sarcina sp.]
MKKILGVIIGLTLVVGGFVLVEKQSVQAANIEDISQKIIRFHVLANSDSKDDQNLKLKIRDEVIKYMTPILESTKSLDESRKLLLEEKNNVINIAKKIVTDEGYNYNIQVELAKTNFPAKTYGNITLPQGEYEAYRILIGEAKGQNWWCVMFPPLCFIDMSKGQISYEESEKKIEGVFTEDEKELITNQEDGKFKFKFKLAEIFEK